MRLEYENVTGLALLYPGNICTTKYSFLLLAFRVLPTEKEQMKYYTGLNRRAEPDSD